MRELTSCWVLSSEENPRTVLCSLTSIQMDEGECLHLSSWLRSSWVRNKRSLLWNWWVKSSNCCWSWSICESSRSSSLERSSNFEWEIWPCSQTNSLSGLILTLFLADLLMNPTPSRTLVMSYILLFWTPNLLTKSLRFASKFPDFRMCLMNFWVRTKREWAFLAGFLIFQLEWGMEGDCSPSILYAWLLTP